MTFTLSTPAEADASAILPAGFRATVAAFNRHSIRACQTAGFRQIAAFAAARDGREFVVL
jgi:hypothetical protein